MLDYETHKQYFAKHPAVVGDTVRLRSRTRTIGLTWSQWLVFCRILKIDNDQVTAVVERVTPVHDPKTTIAGDCPKISEQIAFRLEHIELICDATPTWILWMRIIATGIVLYLVLILFAAFGPEGSCHGEPQSRGDGRCYPDE